MMRLSSARMMDSADPKGQSPGGQKLVLDHVPHQGALAPPMMSGTTNIPREEMNTRME